MNTYMFPGQGSQFVGMGKDLFDEFKEEVAEADEILGYSIRKLCLEDPGKELNNTKFTQPALFVVNALSYLRTARQRGAPDYLAGHSLGEFNALLAADCFSFATGLRLVKRRGELMSRASQGAMAALLNGSREEVEAILRDNGLNGIDLANYNSRTQIVISGTQKDIAAAQPLFEGGKIFYYPLNTSGAFHSRYMRDAGKEFAVFLESFQLEDPSIPVIANVSARPYEKGEVVQNLSKQIHSSVRWAESIEYLLDVGPMDFLELGNAGVLTKLVDEIRRNKPSASLPSIATRTRTDKGATAAEKVAAWNGRHPIGTRVRSQQMDNGELETRSEALVLFGHRAAVYMQGYEGYFDLDEITAPV